VAGVLREGNRCCYARVCRGPLVRVHLEPIRLSKANGHGLGAETFHQLPQHVCCRDNKGVAQRITSDNVAVHTIGCAVDDDGTRLAVQETTCEREFKVRWRTEELVATEVNVSLYHLAPSKSPSKLHRNPGRCSLGGSWSPPKSGHVGGHVCRKQCIPEPNGTREHFGYLLERHLPCRFRWGT
jgi:hypothetical protein